MCIFIAQVRYVHSQDISNDLELSQNETRDESDFPLDETLDEPMPPRIRAWDEPVPMGFGETMTSGLIASGYSLLSNTIVMLFNRFVVQASWAFVQAF
ncbi:MAG: hypothetical protein FWB78_01835 [Treponema sp.]|nr:hypothetical protein [Treponema sp.]